MSKETEKIFQEFRAYLEKQEYQTDEEIRMMFEEFISEYRGRGDLSPRTKAICLLDQAYRSSYEEAYRLAKKALSADRDYLDAKIFLAEFEQDPEKKKKYLEKALDREREILADQGYFEEKNIGKFYKLEETRPYLRAKAGYITLLTEMRRFRKAAGEMEEILRLNEKDNMGARHHLISVYARLEETEKAEDLYEKYKGSKELHMVLPMVFLYHKSDRLADARRLLKKACRMNGYLAAFFMQEIEEEEMEGTLQSLNEFGYQRGEFSEVLDCIDCMNGLIQEEVYCKNWMMEELRKMYSAE